MTKLSACPECGYPLEGAENTCPNCGTPLEPTSSHPETHDSAMNADTVSTVPESETTESAADSGNTDEENGGVENGIFCTNCGARNPADANFCYKCGTPIKVPAPRPRTRKGGTKKVGGKQKRSTVQGRGGATEKKSGSLSPNMLYGGFAVIAIIILAIVYFNRHADNDSQAMADHAVHLQSLEAARQAMQNDPGNPDAVLHYANKLFDTGMFQQAIEMYQKYLVDRPEDSNARIDMGVCYFQLGQFEQAKDVMEEALKYDPKHQKGHYNLGIVNIRLGDTAKAREWFRKTIEINPDADVANMARKQLAELDQG
ncbi:MAG: tetratricopeptide repeat protein [Chlorobi bacterium]|nr:tetratricopeptide repeat protein [Chlorobiota bacterium]